MALIYHDAANPRKPIYGPEAFKAMMEVPDLDAALLDAVMIPTAAFGSIEIGPVMDYT